MMFNTILIITAVLFFLGLVLLVFLIAQQKQFGALRGNRVYQDTDQRPGDLLYSSVLPLIGKPDYIVKEKNTYFPIEIKTGKTPRSPYNSHIMQLIAYCHLIEQNYHVRPTHGIIKYPEKEFVINYTKEYEHMLKTVVETIQEFKKSGYGDYFRSNSFGICPNCKNELKQ